MWGAIRSLVSMVVGTVGTLAVVWYLFVREDEGRQLEHEGNADADKALEEMEEKEKERKKKNAGKKNGKKDEEADKKK